MSVSCFKILSCLSIAPWIKFRIFYYSMKIVHFFPLSRSPVSSPFSFLPCVTTVLIYLHFLKCANMPVCHTIFSFQDFSGLCPSPPIPTPPTSPPLPRGIFLWPLWSFRVLDTIFSRSPNDKFLGVPPMGFYNSIYCKVLLNYLP